MKVLLFVLAVLSLHLAISASPSYYTPLTVKQAQRLASWTSNDAQAMWQLSGQYEGDMVFMPGQRNGVIDEKLRWPNREIPYELSDDFTLEEKVFISEALKKEYATTCIRVRPKTNKDRDYIHVTGQNTGCWSYVGRTGGRQILNLQRRGCLRNGTIAHEFLHAAGFYHQQSASDRDDYVTIMWDNIAEGHKHNFDKFEEDTVSSFGEIYDYGSVMHYDAYAFSNNGWPTIVPKDPTAHIGQNLKLSQIDIKKLNKMYKCA